MGVFVASGAEGQDDGSPSPACVREPRSRSSVYDASLGNISWCADAGCTQVLSTEATARTLRRPLEQRRDPRLPRPPRGRASTGSSDPIGGGVPGSEAELLETRSAMRAGALPDRGGVLGRR